MRWLEKHMALVFAVSLFLTALMSYLRGHHQDLSASIGFAVVGFLIFLIWLGTRNER